MTKLYATLRGQMIANEYSMPQLGRKIGLGKSAMSERLNGHKPFTMDEAYTIMTLFHIPIDRLHELFPLKGLKSGERYENGRVMQNYQDRRTIEIDTDGPGMRPRSVLTAVRFHRSAIENTNDMSKRR